MKKKTILIIEDEEEISRMLKLRFTHAGFLVEAAFDGEEGLAKVKSIKPDLIILDVKMPQLDGIEVCKILKADPNYKNIPILMLSVKVTGQEQKEGLAAGANAYLTKPYEGDKLMSTAKKLLKAK